MKLPRQRTPRARPASRRPGFWAVVTGVLLVGFLVAVCAGVLGGFLPPPVG